MSAWLALLIATACATVTVLSFRANREAARTGRQRFLFWLVDDWGERKRNSAFFKYVQAGNHHRTFFFGLLTIVAGAFFLEAIGVIY